MNYPVPGNEAERLAVLRALDVLDSPLEERYERITRLLARALNVRGAALALVDRDRLWFKSIVGFQLTQIPREESFCAHAICGSDMLVVPDALQDDRFRGLDLVQGKECVRFYAGYPLTIGNDYAVGTLCVFDQKARTLNEDERQFLRDMTETVLRELRSTLLR